MIGGVLPYLPFGHTLGFTHLPFEFYPILMVLVIVYLTFVEFVKTVVLPGAGDRGPGRGRRARVRRAGSRAGRPASAVRIRSAPGQPLDGAASGGESPM